MESDRATNPTLRDVARMAGVSITTASRVMGGSDHPVAEELRERVRHAAKTLNFTPNAFARGLSKREVHLIGLLVPDLRSPYFIEIARSIEDMANQQGYMVVLCNTDRDARKERRYFEELRAMRAGVILAGSSIGREEHLSDLANHPAPIVGISRHELPCSSVLVDSFRGAIDATTHLVRLGHTRIAHISGPADTFSSADRVEGFRLAMRQAGLEIDESLVVESDYTFDGGGTAFRKLMTMRRPPTAIFAANDQMALGAIREATRSGPSIPGEVSLVGFDGVTAAAQSEPPLTTIHLSLDQIGRVAAEMLLQQLETGRRELRTVTVKGELVARGSTSAPNPGS